MTRKREMDGTFARKDPPPTHYHAGTWNTPRPGLDCDDCREAPCPLCGHPDHSGRTRGACDAWIDNGWTGHGCHCDV